MGQEVVTLNGHVTYSFVCLFFFLFRSTKTSKHSLEPPGKFGWPTSALHSSPS